MMVRPLYEPHAMQTRCGILGAPHEGHVLLADSVSPSWERLLFFFAFEVFLLGTAISHTPCSFSPQCFQHCEG